MGSALATIEGDDMKFRVLGCRGDWLQVINARHGNVWIDQLVRRARRAAAGSCNDSLRGRRVALLGIWIDASRDSN